jgi:hypothetical protein
VTVAYLDDHRQVPADDNHRCSCGSAWFTLDGRAAGALNRPGGAVTLSADGSVTGYAGVPVCAECGEQVVLDPAGARRRG